MGALNGWEGRAMIPQLAQLLSRYNIPTEAPTPVVVEPVVTPVPPKPKPAARKQPPRKGRK